MGEIELSSTKYTIKTYCLFIKKKTIKKQSVRYSSFIKNERRAVKS